MRVAVGAVFTVLAVALVLFGLVVPDDYGALHAASFVRIPLEALIGVAVLVVLSRRPRLILAAVLGVVLGLLTILKIVDLGFTAILARHFNLVLDWILLGDATGVVQDSIGTLGAVLVVIAACLLVIAILVLMTLAVLRVTRLVAARQTATLRTVSVLAVVWIALATFGVQVADTGVLASRADASLVANRFGSIRNSLHDQADFEAQAKVDPFKTTPGNQLLNGLRGKDVLLTFVESYGRYAVEDPRFAPPVDAQLDAATKRLDALGYGSRSAFLSSSTVGGAAGWRTRRCCPGSTSTASSATARWSRATGSPSPARSRRQAGRRSASSRRSPGPGPRAGSSGTSRTTTRATWATRAPGSATRRCRTNTSTRWSTGRS